MDAELLEPHTVSMISSGNGVRPHLAEGRTGVRRSGKLNVRITQADSNLTITIQDNGEGMSAETLEHLFDPFYTTKASGTGLGLSVVKGIIDEHNGNTLIDSKKGLGTRVRITLPLSKYSAI